MMREKVRVLLILPEKNTTMEPEFRAYCPEIDELLVARVPRTPRPLEVSDLPAYRDSTIKAISPFIDAGGIDLLIYGCTSAGFIAGREGHMKTLGAISALAGAPVVSTASAILEVLGRTGAASVDVVSPYPLWKNDMLKSFLSAAGFRIERMDSFNTTTLDEIAGIRAEQVFEKAMEIASPNAEALFIACSQLPTRQFIPELSKNLSRPVWSSVKAAAWLASDILKANESAAGRSPAAH